MFQFLYPSIVQQFSLLLLSSAFLFLGLNVAVAWGQTQNTPKTSINKMTTARKSAYTSIKKTTQKSGSTNNKSNASSTDFALPDGEYLEESPATVQFPKKK
jgi:hypothetical protein